MSEFTYDVPDERKFFGAVQQLLTKSSGQKENQIGDKLRGGKCSIVPSSQFSRMRWNAYNTTIHFYISIENLEFFDKDTEEILLKVCDRVMPKETGYDVMNVEVGPILEDVSVEYTLADDLEEIQESIPNKTFHLLPDDVREKGKEMAEVYTYLYCVENSLRIFIDRTFCEKFGKEYWDKISIPMPVQKSIQIRKNAEHKNQWISVRGSSNIFYLDFKDLSTLVVNNWDYFKGYFPDTHWLNVKVDELASCRNLIAHNSYVSSFERDVIRLNYNQILKQISIIESKKEVKK